MQTLYGGENGLVSGRDVLQAVLSVGFDIGILSRYPVAALVDSLGWFGLIGMFTFGGLVFVA